MNNRERYLASLKFGEPDRIPLEPGYPRESTLAAWYQQGLPNGDPWYQGLMENLGLAYEPPSDLPPLGVDFRMIPQFEEKILEHRDGHFIVQDWMGAITEISDQYDYTYIRSAKDFVTRKWHQFPVQSVRDWETKIRSRYQVDSEGRFPENFSEYCKGYENRHDPLKIAFNGPFWQLREWCGFEGLCGFMIEDPIFVEEMVLFWQDFVKSILVRMLENIVPDYVLVNEDMAYKEHSMISPRMVERFLLPSWHEWVRVLKNHGVPLVFVDSDGYVGELIPFWIDAGFDGTSPVEVAAGNDIVAYREQYGVKVAFEGGIDKRAIATGGDVLTKEIRRVVPPLLELGGYIPGCDHGVPPDISWKNYVEYSRQLAELCGWL